MLLKCSADGKNVKVNGAPMNGGASRGTAMKMTMSTTPTMTARVHRKVMRVAAPHKRYPGGKASAAYYASRHHAAATARLYTPTRLDAACDNSNDSGLGSEQHVDPRHPTPLRNVRAGGSIYSPGKLSRGGGKLYSSPYVEFGGEKLNRMSGGKLSAGKLCGGKLSAGKLSGGKLSAGKLSSGKLSAGKLSGGKLSAGKLTGGKLTGKFAGSSGKMANGGGKLANALARRRMLPATKQIGPLTLSSQLCSTSRDGKVQLQILCQPETQHRARYQTEGSRGAVKDNSGNGFPVVKLVGYDKPAVLQVFIGTDTGRVAPHMFYQACRVSGKNSTPCSERKEDGTVLIEIDLDPVKSWQVTCDCVGILKERNVDVEHRFGEQMSGSAAAVARGKKKSTRCRMVFRTQILSPDGTTDTLQICSSQIICTQPPGVPEICRKSLVSCPATGGLELYLLGKNFLKDSKVVFMLSQENRPHPVWEEHAIPDKEFLQQTHLVCCVPPFQRMDIVQPVAVQMYVWAGGKPSESHRFLYTPPALDTGPRHATLHHQPGMMNVCDSIGDESPSQSMLVWGSSAHMMPPPAPPARRPSLLPEHAPLVPKTEDMDDNSQPSLTDNELSQMTHSDNSNMSLMVNDNSMDENSRHGHIMIDRDDSNLSIMDDNSVASFTNARLLQNQLESSLIQNFGTGSNPASQIMPVMNDNLKAVDLQLKSDAISNSSMGDAHNLVPFGHFVNPQVKLHSPHSNGPFATNLCTKREIELDNRSPLVSFTQQLQAIQTQVQTDKMMETVAAAIFTVESAAATSQQYATRPMLVPITSMGEIERMMATKTVDETISTNMKQIEASIMHENSLGNDALSNTSVDARAESQMMNYNAYVRAEKLQTAEQCEQSAQMEALVNDAMEASIMSTDTVASAKLDALVNSTVDNHMMSGIREVSATTSSPSHGPDVLLSPPSAPVLPPATLSPRTPDTMSSDVMPSRHTQLSPGMIMSNQSTTAEELMMMQGSEQMHTTVTTPPAAVKTMILNAAAEILTSDTAMNALVTSAINTANILSGETASANANGLVCTQAPSAPTAELQELQAETDRQRIAEGLQPVYLPTEGVAQAMSQAVTQAVSQVVSHAVSQAVSQTPTAPMQDLTTMSDSDLLSYINPSCFDQV